MGGAGPGGRSPCAGSSGHLDLYSSRGAPEGVRPLRAGLAALGFTARPAARQEVGAGTMLGVAGGGVHSTPPTAAFIPLTGCSRTHGYEEDSR